MHITVNYTVWCDNCPEWDQLETKQGRTEQNKEAKLKGWREVKLSGKKYTLCPKCVSKGLFRV